jgi:hypothetical protein
MNTGGGASCRESGALQPKCNYHRQNRRAYFSSPETVNLAASAADYQLQTGTSNANVTAGQSATIALTVKSRLSARI